MEGLASIRAICSAPGKAILFGEHAVVYGHPAIAAVTNQRTTVEADCCGDRNTVNGFRIHEKFHSYLMTAIQECWEGSGHIRLQTEGGVPSASGTGSSAALTAAAVAALLRLQGRTELADVAQAAFRVERITQGGGSPTDTSTSVAGGAIAISGGEQPPKLGEHLWNVGIEDRSWAVERLAIPPITVVIGNSGVKGITSVEVAKVARAIKKNAMLRSTLSEIGSITRQAAPALMKRDLEAVGRLMDQSHMALHRLGVGHPEVSKLIELARGTPGTLGTKITGAGGGGSMLALSEYPDKLMERMQDAGYRSFKVTLGGPGVRQESRVDWETMEIYD